MLNYNLPLTEAESEFAAEHHSVIYGYLRKAGLPEDDFYDVVVFGYLLAVRKYLARPELRKYSFSTIAYRAMRCDVHHSKEYWMRKKRRALVESLDEELHTRDLLDPVSAAYENVLSFQELSGKLTQKQRQIAALRSQGYRDLEIARMFRYHGAEHKTIACYESGRELTVENVRPCTRFHPRCGTSFLLIVILISILAGALITTENTLLRIALKLLLLPVVMSVSYEIIKLCGRDDNPLTRAVSAPGLWLQRITTSEPDDGMIECAIAAVLPVLPENPEDGKW